MGCYRYPPIQAFSSMAVELEEEVETSRGCVRNIAQSIGPKQSSRDTVSDEFHLHNLEIGRGNSRSVSCRSEG